MFTLPVKMFRKYNMRCSLVHSDKVGMPFEAMSSLGESNCLYLLKINLTAFPCIFSKKSISFFKCGSHTMNA